jgi:hypothetical protein
MFASAFHFLDAVEVGGSLGAGWNDLWLVLFWASTGLVVGADVSLGVLLWELGKLGAGHGGWHVTWKVTEDGAFCADLDLDLFGWFWGRLLADAAALSIDHCWDVVNST